jgi:hypothetical protein
VPCDRRCELFRKASAGAAQLFVIQFALNSAGDFFAINPMAIVYASGNVKEHHEHFVSGEKKINVEIFSPAIDGAHPAVLVFHGAGGLLLDGPAMRRFAAGPC